jgi:hypothetical protein
MNELLIKKDFLFAGIRSLIRHFFTTKPNLQRTWLGFSWNYDIAKRMGAEIKVDCEEGADTVFSTISILKV